MCFITYIFSFVEKDPVKYHSLYCISHNLLFQVFWVQVYAKYRHIMAIMMIISHFINWGLNIPNSRKKSSPIDFNRVKIFLSLTKFM